MNGCEVGIIQTQKKRERAAQDEDKCVYEMVRESILQIPVRSDFNLTLIENFVCNFPPPQSVSSCEIFLSLSRNWKERFRRIDTKNGVKVEKQSCAKIQSKRGVRDDRKTVMQ